MDTCRSSSNSSLRSEATKGSMVRPQPVTESSLLDSVAGFINEVQALNKPNHDSKIQITWASFQKADINDPGLFFGPFTDCCTLPGMEKKIEFFEIVRFLRSYWIFARFFTPIVFGKWTWEA